jgi:hypothetical protein
MDTVCRWQIANGLREKVNFIFDEQFEQSDTVQATWGVFNEQMPDEYKELFGGRPIHKSDTDTWPLQAADMLAWHIRRRYYELGRGNTFTSPTMEALRVIPGAHDRWTRERLQGIMLDIRRLNTQRGRIIPHEYRDMIKRLPDDISKTNLEIIGNTPSNASALIAPYPALEQNDFFWLIAVRFLAVRIYTDEPETSVSCGSKLLSAPLDRRFRNEDGRSAKMATRTEIPMSRFRLKISDFVDSIAVVVANQSQNFFKGVILWRARLGASGLSSMPIFRNG